MVEYVARRARQVKRAKVYPYGAVTSGCAGRELAEMALLKEAGAVGFTDGVRAVACSLVMRRALTYVERARRPDHPAPRGPGAGRGGVMNEGEIATRLGLAGIPAGRGDHDRARPAPGRADRRALPRGARLDRRRGRCDAAREGARPAGQRRGGAGPFRAERARGRGLPYLRQGLAAAALRGGSPRGRGGAGGRHDRCDRERPLPAGPGQQAPAVRPGRVRRGRARDDAAGSPVAGPRRHALAARRCWTR